ncbi:ABC transporter permease [Thermocrinis sp.]
MKDKGLFVVYLLLIFFLSLASSLELLAIGTSLALLMLLVLPLRKRREILKRTIYVCLFFNFTVSFPYFLAGLWIGQDRSEYILMILLRSFSMSLTTFTAFKLINIYKVFDFSKSLSFLMVIVSSHILVYLKLLEEFKDALKSRTIGHINRNVRIIFIDRLIKFFFERSIHTSEELYQAMKSRGFYD